ncbi:3-dehydroquinate synthase [Solitalea koreensis]|uniref:3-dehydroquinate synthase n=1 Tax=Solitalea koreensis TaxID=543615 RepID=A0A521E923_9SPHI|nr:3-dehydroquinate synthase [Solitalea koreensis]SMO79951.1 3-dehydroquinate synthase [Solitalea koreensis]
MTLNSIKSTGYEVVFGDASELLIDFLNKNSYSKIFFLVDSNTSEHCYPIIAMNLAGDVEYDIIEIDAGEESKNIDICIGIWKMLLDFGADRKGLMINLGGGVTTDMGSFAAATYKRGIDFLQIPTTLLSQVDASVGGKTGIDIDNIKNIIGTFSNPQKVIIDTAFLETLPKRQLVSGFAEIIKHGLIMDKAYFEKTKAAGIEKIDDELIHRSVEIKNEIVTEDPHEKNIRKKLNFGHTIGHAVESYSLQTDENPLSHGEAIAIGMICESWLSVKHSGLSQEEFKEIYDYILSVYPAYKVNEMAFAEIMAYMKNDKKNESDKINFTLLNSIGTSSINFYCEEDEIVESIKFYNGLIK